MNTKDTQDLARLIGKVPGIKSVELKDVRRLAELLHEFPEIGSIEVKGFFDTGVVITRTGNGPAHPASLPMAMHTVHAAPATGIRCPKTASRPGRCARQSRLLEGATRWRPTTGTCGPRSAT